MAVAVAGAGAGAAEGAEGAGGGGGGGGGATEEAEVRRMTASLAGTAGADTFDPSPLRSGQTERERLLRCWRRVDNHGAARESRRRATPTL